MTQSCLIALALFVCTAALAQDWREIKPPPTRQDVSQTYQWAASLDPLDDAARWQGAEHGQSAKATVGPSEGRQDNSKALRVQYEFVGRDGLEYVDVAGSVAIPDEVTAVGLWMKGGEHPLPARMRVVDANGECFQYDLGGLKPGEWRLGVASLDNPAVHWGGDNNGKLDRPCRLASFVFDKLGSPYVAQGEFAIAEFGSYRAAPERLQPHGIKLFVPQSQSLLVYEPGQAVALRLMADAGDKTLGALPLALRAQIVDPFGKIVQTTSCQLTDAETLLTLKLVEPGAYDLQLRPAERPDDPDAPWADFRFAVLPRPPADTAASPFGVSTHFGQSWARSVMPMIARAGIKFYRDEIYWGGIEQEQDKLVIGDKFRDFIAEGQRLGLEPLIILDYANKLYNEGKFPVTPEARAGFARYAATLARGLPAICFFEVWNEWCGGCGMGHGGTAADYAPLFLEAAQAVREANPKATVVGIGGEWDGKAFGEMMSGGAGAAMDAFSIHPYMYPGLPGEGFAKHLTTDSERTEAAAGKKLPLWITEIGWPTELDGRGSDWLHQARCLVRMMLIALANDTRVICWYDFKDDGLKLTYNENNFGLVHHDQFGLAPKPAYVAYAHLIGVVHGRKLVSQTVSPQGLWKTVLEDERSRVTVLWTAEPGARPIQQQLATAMQVEDMFGRRLPSMRSINVTADPVFVIGRR